MDKTCVLYAYWHSREVRVMNSNTCKKNRKLSPIKTTSKEVHVHCLCHLEILYQEVKHLNKNNFSANSNYFY